MAETVGLWFVTQKLVIPIERQNAALWIYQSSIFSMICTILTAPFMASIIAHEDMNIYAYVSIIEVVLKLGIVFLLPLFAIDKLIFYGLLMAGVNIVGVLGIPHEIPVAGVTFVHRVGVVDDAHDAVGIGHGVLILGVIVQIAEILANVLEVGNVAVIQR